MSEFSALNFKQWIDDNRQDLKPPVGNKQLFEVGADFIVMVVGGPNARKDFHLNNSEEFFYQIEGDMTLKIMDEGKPVDIPIKEGDVFLLPPNIPHSPQRQENTIGLVIERKRKPDEEDGLRWYCDNCNKVLHEEHFPLVDIVGQLKTAIENFYSNEELRTCGECGTVAQQ